jgi:hypothetical protein
LLRLNSHIKELLRTDPSALIWNSFPNKEQRIAVAELALMVAHARQDRTGLHTKAQIGWAWSQLGRIKTLPKFLRWFAGTFFEQNEAEGIDAAFQFLQACEFSFPRSLAAIKALILHAQPDADINYGVYIVGLENWFRPAWMKELDEAGIPLPLAERLNSYLNHPTSRANAIEQITALDLSRMGDFDVIDRFILDLAFNVS